MFEHLYKDPVENQPKSNATVTDLSVAEAFTFRVWHMGTFKVIMDICMDLHGGPPLHLAQFPPIDHVWLFRAT